MAFMELIKNLIGKKGWDYEERRGKKRVKCRIDAGLVHGTSMCGVEIRNISIDGMKLFCMGKVRKGTTVQLKGIRQYNEAQIHELNCKIQWVKKDTGGWLAGVSFLDSAKVMSLSWLFYELKSQGVKMTAAETKRSAVRVRTNIPAKLLSHKEQAKAKVVNLSPSGAMIQVLGQKLEVNEVVNLDFGPLETLPRITVSASIASVHVEGAPVYGLRFMSYSAGGPDALKKYLDFFFRE